MRGFKELSSNKAARGPPLGTFSTRCGTRKLMLGDIVHALRNFEILGRIQGASSDFVHEPDDR
jgi:hypothetical protein